MEVAVAYVSPTTSKELAVVQQSAISACRCQKAVTLQLQSAVYSPRLKGFMKI